MTTSARAKFGQFAALARNRFGGRFYCGPAAMKYGDRMAHPGKFAHQRFADESRAANDENLHATRILRELGYPVAEMPVIVSLLRGVNVGGNNKVKMDALRKLYESLGLRRVETFIQSGNVVFESDARDTGRLARRIEAAIEKQFGFGCDVVLRTADEIRGALKRNPFGERQRIDPAKLLITFLGAEPDREGCAKLSAMDIAPRNSTSTGARCIFHSLTVWRGRSSPGRRSNV